MLLKKIDGCLTVEWNEELQAVVDTWFSYSISEDEFQEAILENGLSYAKSKDCHTWVVDSSIAIGVLPERVHAFIESTVIPSFSNAGIKRFVSISSDKSVLTQMNVDRFCEGMQNNGVQVHRFQDFESAKRWLKQNPVESNN